MQMLLITHADRQNANICFSAKPSVISRKTNVYQKKKKTLRVNVYMRCDTFWRETETHKSLCVVQLQTNTYTMSSHIYIWISPPLR